MLTPGSTAPDFTLPDQAGAPRSLASLLAAGPLLLYFYPADFTPACTMEACSFRDSHAELLAAGLTLAGISPQGESSHGKFAERFNLPFPLLADAGKGVTKAYDAVGPFGIGVRRITYLITPDRRIADAVLADLNIARHTAFVRRAIDAARPAPRTPNAQDPHP